MLKKEVEAQLNAMSSKYHNLKGNHTRVLKENGRLKKKLEAKPLEAPVNPSKDRLNLNKAQDFIAVQGRNIEQKNKTIADLRSTMDQKKGSNIGYRANVGSFVNLPWWKRMTFSKVELRQYFKEGQL